jgi:hypothetical protein
VAPLDVCKLVRGDESDLAVGEPPIQKRVVEHDAARRPEPGDVGVRSCRPPARVGNEDVVDPDAELVRKVLDLGNESPICQRLEAVEERLHHEWLEDDEKRCDADERRCADDPPAAPEPPGKPNRSGNSDGHEHRLNPERRQLVDEPAGPALLGEPEIAAPDERDRRERKPDQPDGSHDDEPDQHRRADAPAADRLERDRKRPRRPYQEQENGDLGSDRPDEQEPREASVVVDPIELGRDEIVAWVEVRKSQLRNPGLPQEDRRADPEARERRDHEGLR